MALESVAIDVMCGASATVAPLEACGLLFGEPGRIVEASIARNVAEHPERHFEIDPQHLFDAQRKDRAGPMRLMGCWHSHPNGNPNPSQYDLEGAFDEDWLWLIVADGRISGWRREGLRFVAVELSPSSL